MEDKQRINNLNILAQLSLFGVSYAPLFIIILLRLISNNLFDWQGKLSLEFIREIVGHFAFEFTLMAYLILSFIGTIFTMRDKSERVKNGFNIQLKNVNNKSPETLNYLATYIIPFVYDVNGAFDIVIMFGLLFLIFLIFRNSSLLLVNPILSFKYGVYDITFIENGVEKTAVVLSPNKFLIEKDELKIYAIGHRMYYGIKNN
ncbi:MAG: hypothetical protein MJ198_09445 [Bacteroidales bacterium]|nr:hypothetical protein [Bacteroidales bacterium]